MIKKSIKTLFQNLIYIFVPLGCLYLSMVLGIIVLYHGLAVQCNAMVNDINGVLQDSQIRIDDLVFGIIKSAAELPWDNPIDAVLKIFSTNWLMERITEIVGVTSGTVEYLVDGIMIAVQSALNGLHPYIATFFVILFIGLFGGFFVTKHIVKLHSIKHRKFFLWSALESFVFLILFIGGAWLLMVWKFSFYISLIVAILLFGFITMTEAYVSQPVKTVNFKQVVNIKNSFSLILSYIILLVVCGVLLRLIYAVTNMMIAVSLGYSLICIVMTVISLCGKLYIEDLAEKQQANLQDNK